MLPQLVVLLISIFVLQTDSKCHQSFVTICETMEDFKQLNPTENLSEVMIGSYVGATNMTTVDFMQTLKLNRYNKLLTLMVVRAVDKLEVKQYGYQCSYYGSTLQNFILYGNILTSIEAYHFPVMSLKKMSLVNNQIESVKPFGLKSIGAEILDLSDNLLEDVEFESLPGTNKTKVISIKNNKINYIEAKSFPSSLESLNLDQNKLRHIQDGVLNNLLDLQELTLSRNKFNAFPKIDHLSQLVVFDISHNEITALKKGTFKNMDKLKVVDLSNNRIDNKDILQWINTPGKQPELTVSLAFNRLKYLDLNNVDLQKQTFYFYGNPWDCNEWTELKKNLTGHESQCDVEFQSSGSVPYCINYRTDPYPLVSQWQDDIDRLHGTVRKIGAKAGCTLDSGRYQWLYPIRGACVA